MQHRMVEQTPLVGWPKGHTTKFCNQSINWFIITKYFRNNQVMRVEIHVEVNEFELPLRKYVHFRTNNLWKTMNRFFPSQECFKQNHRCCSIMITLALKYSTEVGTPLNKKLKPSVDSPVGWGYWIYQIHVCRGGNNSPTSVLVVHPAEAVEYTDCISAER